MAVGDLFWFDHATIIGFPDTSAFTSGEVILLGLNTTAGVTSTSTGLFSSYTQASTGTGTTDGYASSGSTLGYWGGMWDWPGSGKVATFGYAQTDSRTLFAVDLGDVDMTAGDLTINNQSLH